MMIRAISDQRAMDLIREWNGQTSSGKAPESERIFQNLCDRYVLVDVENLREMGRLNSMEKYLTGGHGFYIYVRYPLEVLEAIRGGYAAMPEFVHRAEERYSSACNHGNLRLLLGFVREDLDPGCDLGLFIDILDQQKQAEAQREAQAAQAARQTAYQQPIYPQQPAYQPPTQQTYQQPAYQQPTQQTYQQPAYQQQPQQPAPQPERRTNVIHYHFGDQVS